MWLSKYIPKSTMGKISVYLGFILFIVLLIEILFVILIKGDPAVVESSFLLSALAAFLSMVFTLSLPLSLITGGIALIKNREWVIVKTLSVIYGLSILLFVLGEVLFPH